MDETLANQNCTIDAFAYSMQCTPALLQKYSLPGMEHLELTTDLVVRLVENCVYLHECQGIEINPVDILIGDIE